MTQQEHIYIRYGAYDLIKSILLGLVILTAGITIGASLMFLYQPKPPEQHGPEPEIFAEQMLRQLGRELNLTPQQRHQLEPILREHHKKLTDIRAAVRPEIVRQLEQLNADITAVLTPEQIEIWQQKVQRIEKRFPTFRGPGHRQGMRPGFGQQPGRGPGMAPGPEQRNQQFGPGPLGPRQGMHQPPRPEFDQPEHPLPAEPNWMMPPEPQPLFEPPPDRIP